MSDAIILVVEDDPLDRELLAEALGAEGHTVITAGSAHEALEALDRASPDLLLVDVLMPGMDGIEFCRRLKGRPQTRLIPLMLVTALTTSDDRVRGIEAGADDYLSKPLRLRELRARVRSLLRLKRYTDQLEHAETVLYSLALGVEAKDPGLEGHCARLAHYAAVLGQAAGLGPESLEALRRGGVLHDVGKIGIPDAILFKPGPLTFHEWKVMREHPVIGERICQPLKSMQPVLPIIRHHHERWNGSGYPDGLAGPAIPTTARILQVADVFDALTTVRSYKKVLAAREAIRVMRQQVGEGLLDGDLVEPFACLWAAGALSSDRCPPLEVPPAAHPKASPRTPRIAFTPLVEHGRLERA